MASNGVRHLPSLSQTDGAVIRQCSLQLSNQRRGDLGVRVGRHRLGHRGGQRLSLSALVGVTSVVGGIENIAGLPR